MDGLEVLKTVKADADLASIPVVILTTSAAGADMTNAYGNHANSYLVKPVDFSQFHKLMDALGFYWLVWNQSSRPRGDDCRKISLKKSMKTPRIHIQSTNRQKNESNRYER